MSEVFKDRLKRLAPKVGYPLFYLFALVLFLSLTFPYDKLKERIVTTFNAQQRASSTPTELQIEELDSSWLLGIKAKGVKLTAPSSDPAKPSLEIKLDEVRGRISLLGLLVGNKDVSFRIEAFGGLIKGTFEDTGKERSVDVTFEDVDVSKVDAIAANVGFPLDGKLGGTVKLQLPEGKASKAIGPVNLEIKDMYAGNATELTVKTPLGPFTLPRLKVGSFVVTGEAKDGIIKLTKMGASGGDVDVTGDGRVQLREVATDAHLEVALKFKINDSYRNKNDKTKMLFGSPGSKEKPMLEMDARMAKSKTADGFYGLTVGGTLGKPDVQPAAGGVVPGINLSGSTFGRGPMVPK